MNVIEKYAEFVARHPYLMILLVVMLSAFAIYESGFISNDSMDYRDLLPDDIEVMKSFKIIGDSFGSSESAMIAVEADPAYARSNEPRDVRDADVIAYIDVITSMVNKLDDVTGVKSASTVLRAANNGSLPHSRREVIELSEGSLVIGQYISSDYQMSIIKINLADDFSDTEMADELIAVIQQAERPPGIDVNIAGESMTGPVVNQQMGPDMQKTSRLSLVAILIILVVLMRSFKYAVHPLLTIGVGVTLAFGYVGLMRMNMTPATSGVISMIMGIGIDFGIQTVTRFRQELRNLKAEKAIVVTLSNVFVPMATTTLAALIGFRAMAMGKLTLLADMGDIMTYGVAACFVAAVTLLPAMLVLGERIRFRRDKK